ncbi:hypothetical protein ACFQZC_04430 [Streptacidiphilus monticola]
MSGPIRVVVADRRRAVASLLAAGLEQSGLVSRAAAGMAEVRRLAEAGGTDVVVADIGLLAGRGGGAADGQRGWGREFGVPVIVLSEGAGTDELAPAAVRAGSGVGAEGQLAGAPAGRDPRGAPGRRGCRRCC